MDHNFTDFTKNDTFNKWTSSDDISSSTDRVGRPPPAAPLPQRAPRPARPAPPRAAPPLHKRPHYDTYYGEPPAKRAAPSIRVGSGFKWNLQTLAAAADAVESGGKSPVSALNELGVRVAYSVLRQGGPAHCPSFHVAVAVADMRFEGWGHSKREARAAAARTCLAALLARAGRVLPAPSPHQDFTSDEPPVSEFQRLEPAVKAQPPPEPAPLPTPPRTELTNGTSGGGAGAAGGADPAAPASLFGSVAASAAHKSPINVLYENYSGLTFTCTFGDGSPLSETQAPLQLSHSMRFKVVCQIKEHKFEGYGSSKKLAKLAAARSALAALEDTRRDSPPAATPHGALHQTLADHIGKLVNEKFNELMKNDLVHSKRKVLAGIVITTNNRIEDARVIAVTTGTKCVSGEHMSVTGRAVNDCHAEVAARRCLQRHLYAQLLMYANQPDPTVPLEESDVEPVPGGGYQLKPSRGVHLYVSTAPCGDGRIFSPHEHHHAEPDKHPNRLARGQLRTKIESGEGTIPVKNCSNVLQTWDGVMQGERLLTMSCSDKVARWSVCGLQGALLSRLLRPVYLQSLVLGSLLHPHHMYRAICGRFEAYISSLPPPFHLQRPLLSRAASTEARTPARAPSFSVCWCATQQLPEVINATTGKLESGQPSLLCKQSMFARWHYLVRRLPLLPQEVEEGAVLPEMPDKPDTLLYNEAKQMCPTYQLAKQRLIDAFDKAKLGRWIKRPLEQDQFVCEITDADPSLLFAWVSLHPPATGREGLGQGPSAGRDSSDSTGDNHGSIGTRSLSYYNYRNSKTLGQASNKNNLPKSKNTSISSRLLQARINDYNLSNNRSVLDLNVSSRNDDDDDYWEGLDVEDNSNDDEWDDEVESKQLNDQGNVSVASNKGIVTLEDNIKDIIHKLKDVSLSDEKKHFWSEFYKRRQVKSAVTEEHTKDKNNDVSSDRSNIVDDFNNLSDSVFKNVDANSHSLGLRTRDGIKPRVLETKDTSVDESFSESNADVTDCGLDARRYREFNVGASIRDTVVKHKNIELLRRPRQVRFNLNLDKNSTKIEEDDKENTNSNKIIEDCEGASARERVTSSLLLRRLQIYEKIRTKSK